MSTEQSEIPGDREQREAGSLVYRPRRCVAGIAAGFDDHYVHARPLHVLGGVLREPGTDPAPLVVGVDADDLDHAHAFVERVQRDCGEPDRLTGGERHENVALLAQTARLHRLGLVGAPVGVQAEEDLIAEYFAKRVEDRLPGAERERDDGVEVAFAELADLDRVVGHGSAWAGWADANRASVAAMAFHGQTVRTSASAGPACGNVTRAKSEITMRPRRRLACDIRRGRGRRLRSVSRVGERRRQAATVLHDTSRRPKGRNWPLRRTSASGVARPG